MGKEPILQFIIEEMQPGDIEAATEMRLKSWLDTYVNEEMGVTRGWIEARNKMQLSEEKRTSRLQRFHEGKTNGTFNAWVARDENGKIIGSTTPFIDENGVQRLGSLYVDKKWHGKGVGTQLMQKAIDWFDPKKSIELGVVTYNERAKAFYRKWGFEEIPNSGALFADMIPDVMMIRKGAKS